MKKYLVKASLKFPSAYDTGAEFEVSAKNKKDAIRDCRKLVSLECLYDRHDGPIKYTATEI